jgi:hypothetical protein
LSARPVREVPNAIAITRSRKKRSGVEPLR